MSDSAQLLRMLEPAVRPVDVSRGGASRPTAEPFESRSFESLLDGARAGVDGEATELRQDAQAGDQVAEATGRIDALGPLSGLGTIENATLRQLMAQHRAGADQNTPGA